MAKLANAGALDKAVYKGVRQPDAAPQPPQDLHGAIVVRGSIDINNDGRPDNVFISVEGTARFSEVFIYSNAMNAVAIEKSPADDWESDALRWSPDRMLLRHDGQWYIIGASNELLHFVSRIGPDNVEKVLCLFQPDKAPATRITLASDPAVCEAARRGQLAYVAFDRLHAVTSDDTNAAGWRETSPGTRAALVDIDNDGLVDVVVPVELASGAGRGCDQTTLHLLNPARTAFIDSPLERVIAEVGGGCGGSSVRPFVVKGKTYLEHKYSERAPGGPHAIYRIENGRREQVCAIRATPVQRAIAVPGSSR